MVLSSTHKIVGSLTQSAILHLGDGERVDEDIVDRSVTLVESTSPNALLTASLDAARRLAATQGHELLDETLRTLERTARAGPGDPGARRARRAARRAHQRRRLGSAAPVGRRARDRGDRPPDRRADEGQGRRRARALLRERDRRRLRPRRDSVRAGRPARRGARARGRGDRPRRLEQRASLRGAAAVGPAGARPARRVPRAPGGRALRRRPRAGSRPSRSPPIRPGCPTSCRASG